MSSTAFTVERLLGIGCYAQDLAERVAALHSEQEDIAGHALAVIAQAAYPGAQWVHIHSVDPTGRFVSIRSDVEGRPELLADGEDAAIRAVRPMLTALLRRLPEGTTGVWSRERMMVTLDVKDALTRSDGYPFLPVQEQLFQYLEARTGREIRRIEIVSEWWEGEWIFCDTVKVDYPDGDGDEVDVDMGDCSADLREQFGDPDMDTCLVFEWTAAGVVVR